MLRTLRWPCLIRSGPVAAEEEEQEGVVPVAVVVEEVAQGVGELVEARAEEDAVVGVQVAGVQVEALAEGEARVELEARAVEAGRVGVVAEETRGMQTPIFSILLTTSRGASCRSFRPR